MRNVTSPPSQSKCFPTAGPGRSATLLSIATLSNIAAVIGFAFSTVGRGAEAPIPAISDFGQVQSAPDAKERPDRTLRYKVVFNIRQAGSAPDKVNASLEKVARFLNLLSADNVRPEPGEVVAIVHGPATSLVLNDAAYRAKNGASNPNLALIEQLERAGVTVRVCSQALAAQHIVRGAVDKAIQIDVSALVTLANLQLRGFALIPD